MAMIWLVLLVRIITANSMIPIYIVLINILASINFDNNNNMGISITIIVISESDDHNKVVQCNQW